MKKITSYQNNYIMKHKDLLSGLPFRHSAINALVSYNKADNILQYEEEPNAGFYCCDVENITTKVITLSVQRSEGPLCTISIFIASLKPIF